MNSDTVWPFRKESPQSPTPSVNCEGLHHHPTQGFGCFSLLFEGPVGYLSLLNLEGADASQAVSLVIKCCASVSNPYQDICRLLRESNWRPHLVGAVAIATITHKREATRELWSAIDRGSWVTPQLAVAAFMRDPMFVDNARERLRSGCLVDMSACARLPALERHILLGPTGPAARSAKTVASLIRLSGLLPQRPDWLSVEAAPLDLQNLLKKDLDSSGDMAERWLSRLNDHLIRLGVGLPSTT